MRDWESFYVYWTYRFSCRSYPLPTFLLLFFSFFTYTYKLSLYIPITNPFIVMEITNDLTNLWVSLTLTQHHKKFLYCSQMCLWTVCPFWVLFENFSYISLQNFLILYFTFESLNHIIWFLYWIFGQYEKAKIYFWYSILNIGFPDSSVGEESAGNAGDPGLIPGLGRSAGEGRGCPL